MFGKKDNDQEEMQRAESETISSIIDESMTITGEITFKGKTKIDGKIHGNIKGEHLILSASGEVKGDIHAISFNCFGTLEGNVKAKILTARKDCYMKGRLETGNLTVEPGASIDGEIKAAAKGTTQPAAKPAEIAKLTPKQATSDTTE